LGNGYSQESDASGFWELIFYYSNKEWEKSQRSWTLSFSLYFFWEGFFFWIGYFGITRPIEKTGFFSLFFHSSSVGGWYGGIRISWTGGLQKILST
jgi:hypothetical protein